MKHRIIIIALALLLLPTTAHAQFGNCTTALGPCASLPQQILEYGRQALQLNHEIATDIQTLQIQIQEIKNTIALPGAFFRDVTNDIRQIQNIAREASLLANNPLAFIGNLEAGYYPIPADGMQQLIAEQNAVGTAVRTLGRVIDAQLPKLADASDTLNSLSAEALGNEGRHQTQQDLAQITAAHGQQQAAMQAITMAEAQARHTVLLAKEDRAAMQNAWADQLATAYTPLPISGAPTYASVP